MVVVARDIFDRDCHSRAVYFHVYEESNPKSGGRSFDLRCAPTFTLNNPGWYFN
jgi:hypothetical protein